MLFKHTSKDFFENLMGFANIDEIEKYLEENNNILGVDFLANYQLRVVTDGGKIYVKLFYGD